MKIISWNCQGGYRKKIHLIEALSPDIAIIQECESFENLDKNHVDLPGEKFWIGDDEGRKGVALFCYNNFCLSEKTINNSRMSFCAPAEISGEINFNLLGIWVKEDKQRKISYFGQLHLSLEEYEDFIQPENTILIGDLNSNKIWDYKSKEINHSQFVNKLEKKDLVSVYHKYFNEPHGAETVQTFFLYRQRSKGYHLDYCFIPRKWMKFVESIEIGTPENWLQFSDHCPLIIEIELNTMVENRHEN